MRIPRLLRWKLQLTVFPGIGYGFTHSLLSKNVSKLFILSGSKDVVDKAGDAVKEELGEEKAKRIHWIQLDLSDWKKAAEVAKEISDNTDRLDIVFNNAGRGIMTFELDQHGVDRHMAGSNTEGRKPYPTCLRHLLTILPCV